MAALFMNVKSPASLSRQGEKILGGILWLFLLVSAYRFYRSFAHGLEPDAAFYLLCAKDPWSSPGLGIFFGFLLHPLWLISGGSAAEYRTAGLLVLGLTIFGFAASLVCFLRGAETRGWSKVICPSLALAGFSHYTRGIQTPGYDWAILEGSLVLASGWLLLEADGMRANPFLRFFAEFLVGLGMVILAAAKWTVLPGYLVLMSFLILGKFRAGQGRASFFRMLLWVFLLGLGFCCYGTWEGLRDTWRAGLVYIQSTDHAGSFGRYSGWLLGYGWVLIRALLWVFALYGLLWGGVKFVLKKKPQKDLLAATVFVLGLVLAFLRGHGQGGVETWGKGSMLIGTWLIGLWFALAPWLGLRFHRPMLSWLQSPQVRVMGLLLALPLLNSAGTMTGIANYINHGAVFWVAAGWLLSCLALSRGLAPVCVAAAFFCIGSLQAARLSTTPEDLMRVGKAWKADQVVLTGPEAGRLSLHAPTVTALQQIDAIFHENGYVSGDPIVAPLSQDCLLVYLLGGTSPGVSWFDGDTQKYLENTAAGVLLRSWVLLRQGQPAISDFWPTKAGVAMPILVRESLFWTDGNPGTGIDSVPMKIYRPANLGSQK